MGVSFSQLGETPSRNESLRDFSENRVVFAVPHLGNVTHGDFVETLPLWYVKIGTFFVIPRFGPSSNYALRSCRRDSERIAAVSNA